MNCKALNNSGNPCKSEVYSSGLCKAHYKWYVRKSKKLKLINPEVPIILSKAPIKKLSKRERRIKAGRNQCAGITKSGNRCKILARKNQTYCRHHRNQSSSPQPIKAKNYAKYIASPEWKSKSKEIKKDFGDRCRLCNRKGILHTHHRTYERLGIEHPEDLIPLCEKCHDSFHATHTYDKKTHTFI